MKRSSTIFLQVVIVLLGMAVLALLLWEPHIEGRNKNATLFEIYFKDPLLALVYAGSIPFFIALYQAFKVLQYVGQNKAFSPEVVKALRTIKYCALAIIGFVVVEEIFIMLMSNRDNDNPGVPVFMGILITFPSIVVAAAAAMFERILQNAVEIKSENDLTV
jgi:cytochrome bd-type quinol oxidase subunit 2